VRILPANSESGHVAGQFVEPQRDTGPLFTAHHSVALYLNIQRGFRCHANNHLTFLSPAEQQYHAILRLLREELALTSAPMSDLQSRAREQATSNGQEDSSGRSLTRLRPGFDAASGRGCVRKNPAHARMSGDESEEFYKPERLRTGHAVKLVFRGVDIQVRSGRGAELQVRGDGRIRPDGIRRCQHAVGVG